MLREKRAHAINPPFKDIFIFYLTNKFVKFVSEREYENVRMGGLRGGAT